MAVVFEEYSGSDSGGSAVTSLSISVPAGIASGDILVAAISHDSYSISIAAPSGWTTIYNGSSPGGGFDHRTWFGYKIADGTETGSFTWSVTGGGRRWAGSMCRYSSADSIDVENYSLDSSRVSPSVTTTVDGCQIVSLAISEIPSSALGAPAGMTLRGGNQCATTSYFPQTAIADETQATAGSTGSYTWSNGDNSEFDGWTVAIAPASTDTPVEFFYKMTISAIANIVTNFKKLLGIKGSVEKTQNKVVIENLLALYRINKLYLENNSGITIGKNIYVGNRLKLNIDEQIFIGNILKTNLEKKYLIENTLGISRQESASVEHKQGSSSTKSFQLESLLNIIKTAKVTAGSTTKNSFLSNIPVGYTHSIVQNNLSNIELLSSISNDNILQIENTSKQSYDSNFVIENLLSLDILQQAYIEHIHSLSNSISSPMETLLAEGGGGGTPVTSLGNIPLEIIANLSVLREGSIENNSELLVNRDIYISNKNKIEVDRNLYISNVGALASFYRKIQTESLLQRIYQSTVPIANKASISPSSTISTSYRQELAGFLSTLPLDYVSGLQSINRSLVAENQSSINISNHIPADSLVYLQLDNSLLIENISQKNSFVRKFYLDYQEAIDTISKNIHIAFLQQHSLQFQYPVEIIGVTVDSVDWVLNERSSTWELVVKGSISILEDGQLKYSNTTWIITDQDTDWNLRNR